MAAVAIDLLWREAADHHAAGRPQLAGVLCHETLKAQPDHLPALHLAASIALANGDLAEGVALLGRLFRLDPNHVPAMVTLGEAFKAKGCYGDAAALFQRAVALRPADVGLHTGLGEILIDLRRFPDAAEVYRSAITLDPGQPQLRFNLAIALAYTGRFAEAEDAYRTAAIPDPVYHDFWLKLCERLPGRYQFDEAIAPYRAALAAEPANPRVHDAVGAALQRCGRLDDSIFHFRKMLELAPNDITALRKLAALLHQALYHEEAAAIYARAATRDPHDVQTYNNYSACLFELGRFDEAGDACDRVLALKPDSVQALINRGTIFERQDKFEAAIAMYRAAIAVDPNNAESYGNLALALNHQGEIDDALAASHRAVALAPEDARYRFNHSHLLLLCGDLAPGFADYRWRRKSFQGLQTFDGPEWQGESFAGRTLLLFSEQGVGDVLQFARYLPMVAARGGTIIVQVQAPLVPLLQTIPNVIVVPRSALLPPIDLHLALMDLPHVFGTTLATIPADAPYLHANPIEVEAWRHRLGPSDALKVGVVWAGGPAHKGDYQRSLPAKTLLPRLVMPGVQLYSLQKEPRPDDVPVLAALGRDVIDLGPRLNDFADTAAAISALDLVISVDTSVAHLAGALGHPTWLLLPYAQDWRWLRDREDSPWYPSMRLFRQKQPRVWDNALTRATAALRARARDHAAKRG